MMREGQMRNVLLGAVVAAAILMTVASSADNRQVRIVNETGYGIRFIGVSATGDDDWSHNRVISVIRNGTSSQVSLREDGSCKRDIRIAWTRQIAPTILKNFNVCSVTVVTLHYDQNAGTVSFETR
jgi:hypothetical protein